MKRRKRVRDLEQAFQLKFVTIVCALFAPPFDEQLLFPLLEGDFDRDGVRSSFCFLVFFKWKHAVFRQVYGDVKQILAVFSFEQATSSFTDHSLSPRLHPRLKSKSV